MSADRKTASRLGCASAGTARSSRSSGALRPGWPPSPPPPGRRWSSYRLTDRSARTWYRNGGASWATARRMVGGARRQLELPRWQSVAVVLGPDLAGQRDADLVLARTAELLARAGLAQRSLVAGHDADGRLRDSALAADPRVASALVDQRCELAMGAALATLRPVARPPSRSVSWASPILPPLPTLPAMPTPTPSRSTSDRIEVRGWVERGTGGWAVARVPDRGEPLVTPPANAQSKARRHSTSDSTGQLGWSDRRMS